MGNKYSHTFNGYDFRIGEDYVSCRTSNFLDPEFINATEQARLYHMLEYDVHGCCVYVCDSKVPNAYKIGVSERPNQRLKEVYGRSFRIISEFQSYTVARRFEANLHYKFAHKSLAHDMGREWFGLSYFELCECLDYLINCGGDIRLNRLDELYPSDVARNFAKGYLQRKRQGDDE